MPRREPNPARRGTQATADDRRAHDFTMRILVATHHRGLVGGAETYLQALLPLLVDRGHEVAVLAEAPITPGAGGIDALVPGIRSWITREVGGPAALDGVAGWRPEVVFQHGVVDFKLEAFLAASYPSILFAHAYYGTCISGTKRHAFPAVRMCARPFGPACLANYLPRRCGGMNPASMVAAYSLQARRLGILGRYCRILVASRHMEAEYLRQGVPPARLRVAPYFPTRVSDDPTPPAPRPTTGTILMAGRLTTLKGGHLLVPAVRLASERLGKPLRLVVAGHGPERDRLEAVARRHGVEVRMVGWVDAAELTTLMRQADVLAVPSTWPEPFGIVGIEAGCVGLPAVGFAVGGIPEWLRPGFSGELAPAAPPTARGLAAALERALALPQHHQRLREGAWRTARSYTAQSHLDALDDAFSGAVRESGRFQEP